MDANHGRPFRPLREPMTGPVTPHDVRQIVTDFQQWARDFRAKMAAREAHPRHQIAYANYTEMQDYDERGNVDAQLRNAIAMDNWKAVVERPIHEHPLALVREMVARRDRSQTREREDGGYGF
jgi:hypothetical protein